MKKKKYILGDDTINGIKIHNKINQEDLFEYRITHRESLIDDLCMWISEANKDKLLMKADLKLLMGINDEYILSSISTNDYIFQGNDRFDETCQDLLDLNEFVTKEEKIAIKNKVIQQVKLMDKIREEANINIVTCGNCGSIVLHERNEDDIDCPYCTSVMEQCHCPDYLYNGCENNAEFFD